MVNIRNLLPLAALLFQLPSATAASSRPNTTTPCDYYAEKMVGNGTAESQRILMALVLHSALLGPFSKYNTVPVDDFTGALVSTTFEGEAVDLNPYFTGGYKSTNTGKDSGESVNFFGAGGLEAAKKLEPSNGDTTSAQHIFFTHVYSYFGTFLGCSNIGSSTLPAYKGKASMYEVHKFMDLNKAEMGFFVDQAVRGLLSIGFSQDDAQFVNTTLNTVFNKRCAPATPVVPASAGPQLQAICIAADCPLSVNDTCSKYEKAVAPAVASATLVGNYTKAANGSTSINETAEDTGSNSESSAVRLLGGLERAVGVAGAVLLAWSLV